MKFLDNYESFFLIREGLEKLVNLNKLLRLLIPVEDDATRVLTNLSKNLGKKVGDDVELAISKFFNRAAGKSNVLMRGGKLEGFVASDGTKIKPEIVKDIIDDIQVNPGKFDSYKDLIPETLMDGSEFRSVFEKMANKLKTKPTGSTTPPPPTGKSGKTGKSTTAASSGAASSPGKAYRSQNRTYRNMRENLRNPEKFINMKGILEPVTNMDQVLKQLEKIGFGPDSAARSKLFLDGIGEKKLVSFWNEIVKVKSKFETLNKKESMDLIERLLTIMPDYADEAAEKIVGAEQKKAFKLKFPNRESRKKWAKRTIYLGVIGYLCYLYRDSIASWFGSEEEKPKEEISTGSTETSTGSTEGSTEGSTGRSTGGSNKRSGGGGGDAPVQEIPPVLRQLEEQPDLEEVTEEGTTQEKKPAQEKKPEKKTTTPQSQAEIEGVEGEAGVDMF